VAPKYLLESYMTVAEYWQLSQRHYLLSAEDMKCSLQRSSLPKENELE